MNNFEADLLKYRKFVSWKFLLSIKKLHLFKRRKICIQIERSKNKPNRLLETKLSMIFPHNWDIVYNYCYSRQYQQQSWSTLTISLQKRPLLWIFNLFVHSPSLFDNHKQNAGYCTTNEHADDPRDDKRSGKYAIFASERDNGFGLEGEEHSVSIKIELRLLYYTGCP